MKTNKLILLFLLTTWILSGCISSPTNKETIRVSVLRGPSAIAFAGWFKQTPVLNGKEIELTVIDSPELMQALVLRNQTDIAVLPMINAANLYNKGSEYRLAGCPVWGNLYLVEKGNTPVEDNSLYIFGAGTTPDILTRYYCKKKALSYSYNYTFQTVSEIVQAIYAGKVNRAVMGEPYLSILLEKEPSFLIIADLNQTGDNMHFAQTAVLYHRNLSNYQNQLDSLLTSSCDFVNVEPEQAIDEMEKQTIFPVGALTPESIKRCKINYIPVAGAKEQIKTFLELIYQYEPKATGDKLPDEEFYK